MDAQVAQLKLVLPNQPRLRAGCFTRTTHVNRQDGPTLLDQRLDGATGGRCLLFAAAVHIQHRRQLAFPRRRQEQQPRNRWLALAIDAKLLDGVALPLDNTEAFRYRLVGQLADAGQATDLGQALLLRVVAPERLAVGGQLLRPVQAQVPNRPAAEVGHDLPRLGHLQCLVRLKHRLNLRGRVVDALQPAAHPTQRGLATRLRKPVLVRILEQADPLAESQDAVHPLRLPERVPRAVDVEEVVRAGENQRGLRRPHGHVIDVVNAQRHLRGDVLLAILRADGIEQPAERSDVTRGRGGQDAVVGGHQVSRECPAAGVARAADPLGVDLRAFDQVVERPDAVPNAVIRGTNAGQTRADIGQRMLGNPSDHRLVIFVEQLVSLALAKGIVDERCEPMARQEDAGTLVRAGRFAVARMSAGDQYAGKRPIALGQVQVAGHVVAGAALVEHALDPVTVGLDDADRFTTQRRPFGKRTDGGPPVLAYAFDALAHGLGSLQRPDLFPPRFEQFVALLHQVRAQQLARLLVGRKDSEILGTFGRLGHHGPKKCKGNGRQATTQARGWTHGMTSQGW